MASSLHTLTPVNRNALHHLLATERDPHRRQRELVRASLVSCPPKGRPSRRAA